MEDKPPLSELAHYGVPGMKWGVKKARTGDVLKKTNRLDKISSGNASLLRKAFFVTYGATPYRLVKSGGAKKEAARQSARLKAHSERLATGNATFRDLMSAYYNTNLYSVARTLKKD